MTIFHTKHGSLKVGRQKQNWYSRYTFYSGCFALPYYRKSFETKYGLLNVDLMSMLI